MEHVKRLGFIIGLYVQLALPKLYTQEINSKTGLDEGLIEIKKKITFERNIQSKILMICTTQNEAKETDQKLFNTTFEKFKYVSFKLSSLSQ